MAAHTPAELPAELVLDDGARYPAIWLRDNCTCAGCVVPGRSDSGHRSSVSGWVWRSCSR